MIRCCTVQDRSSDGRTLVSIPLMSSSPRVSGKPDTDEEATDGPREQAHPWSAPPMTSPSRTPAARCGDARRGTRLGLADLINSASVHRLKVSRRVFWL